MNGKGRPPRPPGKSRRRLTRKEALDADARNQRFQNIYRMRRVYEAAVRARLRNAKTQ